MKKSLAISTILASLSAVGNSATITVTNNSGPTNTMPMVNKDGAFQNSGIVSLGGFLTLTDAQVTALFASPIDSTQLASILGNFSVLNSGSLGIASGINGVFNFQTNGVDPLDNLNAAAADTWTGEKLFVLAGNAGTLAASTQIFAIRLDTYTVPDLEPSTPTINLRATDTTINGTVLYGGWNNFQLDPTPASVSAAKAAFNMAAVVPEPSTAVLGMLAGLGMIARRRRD